MDKSLLQLSVDFFASFGVIKSRSMFGGFGIFCDDNMFALIVNNQLHFRASTKNEQEFNALGLIPYCYTKRGFPVKTKYYQIPTEWLENEALLLSEARKVLDIAIADNYEKKTTEPGRIKDLPNLRLSTERLLKKAGITSVERLQAEGAAGAFQALQATHGMSVSIDLLWSLEGALTNTHWTVIPAARRTELLAQLGN